MTSADVTIGRRNKAVILAMALALACALSSLGERPANAQDTLYIGKDDPSVTVDMSVIEALGPAPRMPELMMPITAQNPATPTRRAATAPAAARTPVTLRSPNAAKPKPAPQAAAKPAPAATAKAVPVPAAKPKPAPAPATKPTPAPPTPEAIAAAPAKPAPKATSSTPPPPPPVTSAPPPPPRAAPKAASTPAPTPSVAPKPEPKPKTKPQVASTPAAPAAAAPSAGTIQLLFGSGDADLTDDAKKTLSGVAQTMRADDDTRLQLMAFAAGADNEASMARRLSLSRALAVRSYLIAEGVRSTRIDVRALGNKTEAKPADRVDLLIDRR